MVTQSQQQWAGFRWHVPDHSTATFDDRGNHPRSYHFMFMGELFYSYDPQQPRPLFMQPSYPEVACASVYSYGHPIAPDEPRFVSDRGNHICIPCARLGLRAGDYW